MDDVAATQEYAYHSHRLVTDLAKVMQEHRAVGDDFAACRPGLLANLRTLQSALPAAIADVEAAMGEAT